MTEVRREESWIIAYVLGLAASAPSAGDDGRALHVARLRAAVDDDHDLLVRTRQHLRQDPPADPALARDADRLLTAAITPDEQPAAAAGPPFRPGDSVLVASHGRQRPAQVVAVVETGALDPQRRWRILYRWDNEDDASGPPVHCDDDGRGDLIAPAPPVTEEQDDSSLEAAS